MLITVPLIRQGYSATVCVFVRNQSHRQVRHFMRLSGGNGAEYADAAFTCSSEGIAADYGCRIISM